MQFDVKSLILSGITTIITVCSCGKVNPDVPIPPEYYRGCLIGWHLNGSVKLDQIKQTSCSAGMPDSLLRYDVDCYKIEYVTQWKDELVRSEALMVLPRNITTSKYACYCHGTNVPFGADTGTKTFSEYAGPNTGHDYEEIRKCVLPLASRGYCTLCPEYTGFGSTAGRQHPFVYGPELCKCIIDGLLAGRDFIEDIGLEVGKDLYLTGWSQGGSASLATEKYLEEDYPGYFDVKGNSCLAGPFNLQHFVEELFSQPDKFFLTIGLYSWAAYAINYFAPKLQRPSDQIFILPTYDQTSAILVAGATPSEIFRSFYMKSVLNGMDKDFCEALQASSYHKGWTPKSHVYLHHGVDDIIVPFFNSQDAYDSLHVRPGARVELLPEQGKGHFDFVNKYMTDTINDFCKNDGGL